MNSIADLVGHEVTINFMDKYTDRLWRVKVKAVDLPMVLFENQNDVWQNVATFKSIEDHGIPKPYVYEEPVFDLDELCERAIATVHWSILDSVRCHANDIHAAFVVAKAEAAHRAVETAAALGRWEPGIKGVYSRDQP